jgi:hypothetical protein
MEEILPAYRLIGNILDPDGARRHWKSQTKNIFLRASGTQM